MKEPEYPDVHYFLLPSKLDKLNDIIKKYISVYHRQIHEIIGHRLARSYCWRTLETFQEKFHKLCNGFEILRKDKDRINKINEIAVNIYRECLEQNLIRNQLRKTWNDKITQQDAEGLIGPIDEHEMRTEIFLMLRDITLGNTRVNSGSYGLY